MSESKITKSKNGAINIPADYVWAWTDAKTGIEFAIPMRDVTPDGVAYAMLYGWRKASADSHAGVKVGAIVKNKTGDKITLTESQVKELAKDVINKRVSAIKTGTVKAGGGGRKADAVLTEMLTIARTRAKLSAAKFADKFGKGADGVNAFALHRVVNAFANKQVKFNRGNAKHTGMVTGYVAKLRNTAKANIAARSADDGIDLSDIVA